MKPDGDPTHLDLFSGLGGFALAAHWAGYRTLAFCEIDPKARAFLSRAWGIRVEPDIRALDGRKYRGVTLLTGGPPCQPASRAGDQRGEADHRWLWGEALRVLEEANPRECLFENPIGIEDVGLDRILSQMEGIGYEIALFRIPACAVNSPQLRDRYWIAGFRPEHMGDPEGGRSKQCEPEGESVRFIGGPSPEDHMADGPGEGSERADPEPGPAGCAAQRAESLARGSWDRFVWVPCADNKLRRAPDQSFDLAHGLHRGVLAALGNSVVPQLAYEIIRAIRESARAQPEPEPSDVG